MGKKESLRVSSGSNLGLEGLDIGALVFLAMMQATQSAREDLKLIMEKMKTIREKTIREKAGWREARDCQPRLGVRVLADTIRVERRIWKLIDALERLAIFDLKNRLDSLSEMGEMESIRLQMAMDRLSKMMSTLSNMLKKMSEVAEAITRNLK